jgi:hypothetical protein
MALSSVALVYSYRGISTLKNMLQIEILDVVKAAGALASAAFGLYGIGAKTQEDNGTLP